MWLWTHGSLEGRAFEGEGDGRAQRKILAPARRAPFPFAQIEPEKTNLASPISLLTITTTFGDLDFSAPHALRSVLLRHRVTWP